MDYASNIYAKAIATLAKQVSIPNKTPSKSSDDDSMVIGKS